MFIKVILSVLIVCFSIVATSPVLEKRQENNGCPDFKSCNNDLKNAGDLVQSFGQPVSGLICVYSNAASCNIQAGVTSFCAKDGVVYFGYASSSGQMSFNGCP
ncbi:hypothetical protein MP638_000020 [Amoeboaphelidium occidentale]|nr:hypothetical protein MP638_000020 [Amoeboaphelidium occidentale]